MTATTVQQILDQTATSNGFHRFAVEGGSVDITTDALRPCLEDAFDSSMEGDAWLAFVNLDAVEHRCYSYNEIAQDFTLWQEYVDTDGVTSKDEFDAMTIVQKVQIQIDTFGPEPDLQALADS
jgi:hypothetical protein